MEHTKEPWSYDKNASSRPIWGNGDNTAVTFDDRKPSPEDARRIVACVNACAGISTEDLESFFKGIEAQWGDALAVVMVEGKDAAGGWRRLQYEREC